MTTASRCHTCERQRRNRRYGGNWRTVSRTTIATHVAAHGATCQGWGNHGAHACDPTDLTLDHETGLVMCRAANSAKRDRG